MLKKIMAGVLAFSMLVVAGGCGKTEDVPETPVDTPVETPVEVPEETPEETPEEVPEETPEENTYNGNYWTLSESKSETELEETEDIYFVNTELDQNKGQFDITASKIYFEEDGLFVELNLYNGLDEARTNLVLNEFSLMEVVDYNEESEAGTEIILADKVHVGTFKDVVVMPGESEMITFLVPYDDIQNEVYNFERINYAWNFESEPGDTFTLVPGETEPEAEAPEITPEG